MAQIRDVLVHVKVETAAKKRKCHRTASHSVAAGTKCLVIKNSGGLSHKNYCPACAKPILDRAKQRLASLEADMY